MVIPLLLFREGVWRYTHGINPAKKARGLLLVTSKNLFATLPVEVLRSPLELQCSLYNLMGIPCRRGVSLLTPLSTPRSCAELSCIGSTRERSRNSSGASQFEALTAMFEIGVSPVRSPTQSYIIKCVTLRRVANRLYKINHFFPQPDFAKELLLAVSSRFITCKHEQKDMRKVLPL